MKMKFITSEIVASDVNATVRRNNEKRSNHILGSIPRFPMFQSISIHQLKGFFMKINYAC